MTSAMPRKPGQQALVEELLTEGRRDLLARQLCDRERQRAELEDRDQLVRLCGREPPRPPPVIWPCAVRDRALDRRRGDHPLVEGDREELADVLGGVLGEELTARLRPIVLELEVDREAVVLVLAHGGRGDLVATEQRRVLIAWEHLAGGRRACVPSGTKSSWPVVPDEPADGIDVRDARQLDDDAVRALDDDDGLGDAGRVHPPLDDVLDDAHRLGRRRRRRPWAGPGTRPAGRPRGRARAWSRPTATARPPPRRRAGGGSGRSR